MTTPFTRRLFAGLSIDEKKSQPLVQAVAKLKRTADEHDYRMQWLGRENWHITLWFFGSVEADLEKEIRQAIAKITQEHARSIELDVKGVGAFPEPTSARVFWAGVSRTKELVELYERGQEIFNAADMPTDDRAYNPHLTLARFRNPQSATALIEPFARKPFFSFAVNEIVLYESTMQNFYPKYTPLERYKLG
jgi:RNA 2',3'-cyclic 3'-phosphodiesterase